MTYAAPQHSVTYCAVPSIAHGAPLTYAAPAVTNVAQLADAPASDPYAVEQQQQSFHGEAPIEYAVEAPTEYAAEVLVEYAVEPGLHEYAQEPPLQEFAQQEYAEQEPVLAYRRDLRRASGLCMVHR